MGMETTLILYTRPGCPFSAKVLLEAAILGVRLDERSIKNPEAHKELMARGGKEQTPFLIDEANAVSMYESDAIMDYLHARFGSDG